MPFLPGEPGKAGIPDGGAAARAAMRNLRRRHTNPYEGPKRQTPNTIAQTRKELQTALVSAPHLPSPKVPLRLWWTVVFCSCSVPLAHCICCSLASPVPCQGCKMRAFHGVQCTVLVQVLHYDSAAYSTNVTSDCSGSKVRET